MPKIINRSNGFKNKTNKFNLLISRNKKQLRNLKLYQEINSKQFNKLKSQIAA
jgi:hypothetical protein